MHVCARSMTEPAAALLDDVSSARQRMRLARLLLAMVYRALRLLLGGGNVLLGRYRFASGPVADAARAGTAGAPASHDAGPGAGADDPNSTHFGASTAPAHGVHHTACFAAHSRAFVLRFPGRHKQASARLGWTRSRAWWAKSSPRWRPSMT